MTELLNKNLYETSNTRNVGGYKPSLPGRGTVGERNNSNAGTGGGYTLTMGGNPRDLGYGGFKGSDLKTNSVLNPLASGLGHSPSFLGYNAPGPGLQMPMEEDRGYSRYKF